MKQKPPPKTVPRKIAIKKSKTAQMDILIEAQVVADKPNPGIKGGLTESTPVGRIPNPNGSPNSWAGPSYSWTSKTKGGPKTVTTIDIPPTLHFTLKIQTFYGPAASPTQTSVYGRGTTTQDKATGNTSLGFHESCHQNDMIEYLKLTRVPTFTGRTNMSTLQFDRASTAWGAAISKYFDEIEKYTTRNTDEVGYQKSVYDQQKGKRPAAP